MLQQKKCNVSINYFHVFDNIPTTKKKKTIIQDIEQQTQMIEIDLIVPNRLLRAAVYSGNCVGIGVSAICMLCLWQLKQGKLLRIIFILNQGIS